MSRRTNAVWARALITLLTITFLTVAAPAQKPVSAGTRIDLREAQAAFAAKNYDKTIKLISPQLEVASREAFLLLAKAYSANENSMMAMKTLSAAQAKWASDPEISTALGLAQLAAGKEREAKNTLKDVLDANPSYEPAYLAMAQIYEKKKNRYELRLLYQDLISHVGKKPLYLQILCDLTTHEALYDQAFSYCEQAISSNPREPSSYVNIATAYKETGRTSEANKFYKKAADSFSKSEMAQFSYAQFLDEQKKYVESYPYYRRAVQADAKSIRGWLGLAFSALEIQKFTESIAAFEKVCELNDREGIRQSRKAALQIKKLNQSEIFAKYQALITKCEGYGPSRNFL